MSIFNRILPRPAGPAQHVAIGEEVRATREALAANIAGLAQAMEERFRSIAERVDGLRDAQAAEADRIAEIIGERVDDALNDVRAAVDAQVERLAREATVLRDSHDFTRVLRELKRDLGAQISLSSFEAAAEIRAATSALADRPGPNTAVRAA